MTKQHGMGMGLSIARPIVEVKAAKISAGDDAGSGALFGMKLPLEA
jgi:K+-sensing histidine kinase KdpD